MTEQAVLPIEWTEEQWQAYTDSIEALVESRRRHGSLLSTFDVIAGGANLFFATGQHTRIPAKWVFAGVCDGLLPDGILEVSMRLDTRLREANDFLNEFENLEEEVNTLRDEVTSLRRKVSQTLQRVNKDQSRQDAEVFRPKVD